MLKKLFCIFSTICLGNFKTPEFQSESQNDLYNNPLLSTLTSGPVLSGIVLTSNNASPTVYFNFSINVVLKDQNGLVYTQISTVIISGPNIYQVVTGASGNFTFIVFSENFGLNTFTVLASSIDSSIVKGTLDVKVLQCKFLLNFPTVFFI